MPPGFPTLQRARIDPELCCHPPLREPEGSACGGEAIRECVSGGLWVVTQEFNDGRNVTDRSGGCVAFPVGNRDFVDPNLLSNLPLEEIEVESAAADMVS